MSRHGEREEKEEKREGTQLKTGINDKHRERENNFDHFEREIGG